VRSVGQGASLELVSSQNLEPEGSVCIRGCKVAVRLSLRNRCLHEPEKSVSHEAVKLWLVKPVASYLSLGLLAVFALTLIYQVLVGNVPRAVFAVLIVAQALIRIWGNRNGGTNGWFGVGLSLLLAAAILLAK
jgi:protein-S-isoprenylcysteine O-methyltransferase Ste14